MMDKQHLIDPFTPPRPSRPSELVYGKRKVQQIEIVTNDQQELADLYAKGTFRDGNVRQSKRKSRLNKKMQNRRNRRG